MKAELLTKKIKKIAQEIASLSGDIEHNKARKQFYTDLIKQRIFELYDLNKELALESSAPEAEKDKHFLKQNTFGGMFRTEQDAIEKQKNMQSGSPYPDSPEPDNRQKEEKPVPEEPVAEQKPLPVPAVENEPELVVESTAEKESLPQESPQPDNSLSGSPQQEEKPLSTNWLTSLLEETVAKKLQSNDLTQRLQNTPISNFYNTVSISQKHEFIDGLFAGKPDVYRNTLQKVEESGSLQASLNYLNTEVSPSCQWEKKEKLVAEFLFLVRRRFL